MEQMNHKKNNNEVGENSNSIQQRVELESSIRNFRPGEFFQSYVKSVTKRVPTAAVLPQGLS